MWTINAREVVRAMGGPAAVRNILQANGIPRTIKAIEKWIERDSIPSDCLAALLASARLIGQEIDIYQYIRTPRGERVDDIKL